MPKALVLYSAGPGAIEQVAKEICAGAAQTGLDTALSSAGAAPALAEYDLVFAGSGVYGLGGFDKRVVELLAKADWQGKRACIFATHAGRGKTHVEAVAGELGKKGAKVAGTISIQLQGLGALIGRGKPTETDLVRAYAFGERQAYDLLGRRPAKEQEKRRIKGYRK